MNDGIIRKKNEKMRQGFKSAVVKSVMPEDEGLRGEGWGQAT
jgi:hypothetical protein